jgi:surface protein
MKKTLIWIVVPILLAVVCVVGTLAYFIEEEKAENVMTVGNIGIQIVEYERESTSTSNAAATVRDFNNDKLLIPSTAPDDFDYTALDNTTYVDWAQVGKTGYTSPIWDPAKVSNEVDKMVFVENTGSYDAYVRLYFAFEAGNFVRLDRFKEMVHLNKNDSDWTWEWLDKANHVADIGGAKYFIAMATCNVPVKAGELSPISLSQIALDPTAKNGDSLAFGEKYDVLVFAQGVQADGFQDFDYTPATALTEAFGTTVPFDGVTYVPFTDLGTALHSLNGDATSTYLGGGDAASDKVNSVTFSTLKAHPEIAGAHTGVFTANKVNEADFTAYTYYVQNDAGKYDIYVLSCGDTVYAPVESQRLFCNMKALTKVDLANLDVSETTNMSLMFEGCSSLKSLDVKDWDVSKVTNMERMFNGAGITTLDASGWDVGEVTRTHLMFSGCTSLTSVDMTGWKFGKLTTMYAMFYNCSQLTSVDCSDWGVSNVATTQYMFSGCGNLTEANLSGWNLSSLTITNEMFLHCKKLEKLYTLGWSLPNVNNAESMFENCNSLKVLDVSNWNMTNVKAAKMFAGCNKLKALDFSNWKDVTIQSMYRMFDGCNSLANVNVSSWNVSAVTNMTNLFKDCASMTAIDISGWDTSNVTNMTQMFYMVNDNTSLKTITVGGSWSTANVTDDTNMFTRCISLKGGKGTTYNASEVDKDYARIDGGTSNPGYFTEKK